MEDPNIKQLFNELRNIESCLNFFIGLATVNLENPDSKKHKPSHINQNTASDNREEKLGSMRRTSL